MGSEHNRTREPAALCLPHRGGSRLEDTGGVRRNAVGSVGLGSMGGEVVVHLPIAQNMEKGGCP